MRKRLAPEVLNNRCVGLAKVGKPEFKREQENDPSLEDVRKKAKGKNRTMKLGTL